MIGGMDERGYKLTRLADTAVTAVGLAVLLLPVPLIGLFAIAILPPPIALLLATSVGAFAVHSVVRRFNRRDDPRDSKRPPDTP